MCITIETHGAREMIEKLIRLANQLDAAGLRQEADDLDNIVRKISVAQMWGLMGEGADEGCSASEVRLKFNFKRNKFKIADEKDPTDAHCLVEKGMKHDQKFMSVKGGTSGTGTPEANEKVMHNRVNEALRYLYDSYSGLGPNQLAYSYDEFKNMADIELDFDTTRPGSTLSTKEVAPEDLDHVYYEGDQYVEITIGPISPIPNFGRLAAKFIKATIDTPGEWPGTDDDAVFEILSELRNSQDFHAFNKALLNNYEKTFYQISCDQSTGLLDTNKVPGWLEWFTKKVMPHEIGEDDKGVMGQLQRLGVPQIKCNSDLTD